MSLRSLPLFLLASFCAFGAESSREVKPVQNRSPLAQSAFPALPLGSVMPRGWLREQLRIQADGISGHLDEFWPDVGPNSAWLGGSGEGWERGPYFLDGLLPLAYLLDDPKLKSKAQKWVDWTLEHQRPDGGLGPEKNKDWWPMMVMLKVLTQYEEVTGDKRVVPALQRYFRYQSAQLDQIPLKEWAIYRWQDEVLSVLWLYNRTGDAFLLDLARKLHDRGHDWEAQFAEFRFPEKVKGQDIGLATHGVNNAMALKAAAVWSLVSGKAEDRVAAFRMLQTLDRYHGMPNHMFSASEHYAGPDPSQGVELCAVVEAMFSLETEISILGDASLGDRLEQITYNALPATMSADITAHQYDQQPNQVLCTLGKRDWSSNGPESNLFGLEPNFGCCTANLHQGWPKFAASLWTGTPDSGLAAVAYGPSEVRTVVGGGVPVTVVEDTEYPFRSKVTFRVDPERPAAFPLLLRIPAWAEGAQSAVNGQAVQGIRAASFLRIDRQWKKGDTVELTLPMKIRTSGWYHNSVAIERGPLVYSLAIGESWHKLKQTGPVGDFEVYPTTPWNYALVLNPGKPESAMTVEEAPVGQQPFTASTAPVRIKAKGRRLPDWQLENDSAGPLPFSPVTSKRPEESLILIPYGAARLRVTAFPYTLP